MSILTALHAAYEADRDDSVAMPMKVRICWHPTLRERTWTSAVPDVCCLIYLFSGIGTWPSLTSGGMGDKDKAWRRLSWENDSGFISEPVDVGGRLERSPSTRLSFSCCLGGFIGNLKQPNLIYSQTSVIYSGLHQSTPGHPIISDLESGRHYFYNTLWKPRHLGRPSHVWTSSCVLPGWALRQVLMGVEPV